MLVRVIKITDVDNMYATSSCSPLLLPAMCHVDLLKKSIEKSIDERIVTQLCVYVWEVLHLQPKPTIIRWYIKDSLNVRLNHQMFFPVVIE